MDWNSDETIDSEACAALLHCAAKTVEELARQGKLPGMKFGNSWMFFRDQVISEAKKMAIEEAAQRRTQLTSVPPVAVHLGFPTKKRRSPPKLPPLFDLDEPFDSKTE